MRISPSLLSIVCETLATMCSPRRKPAKQIKLCQTTEVLQFAVNEKRALVTLNRRHFIRLHHERAEPFGIIVCTFDPDFLGQAERIHNAITDQKELDGKLICVNRPST
jgi:hypothetical protein